MCATVTENEITKGILDNSHNPSATSVCIIRRIVDIEDHLHEPKAAKYIDVLQPGTSLATAISAEPGASLPDNEAATLLQELRESKVSCRLAKENITSFDVNWQIAAATSTISEKPEVAAVAKFKHESYLRSLCDEFYAKVVRLVRVSLGELMSESANIVDRKTGRTAEPNEPDSSHGPLCEVHQAVSHRRLYDNQTAVEVLQHLHFARSRCEVFQGREETLEAIRLYLTGGSRLPLMVYGQSGCGKTSVLAKVHENLTSRGLLLLLQGMLGQRTLVLLAVKLS